MCSVHMVNDLSPSEVQSLILANEENTIGRREPPRAEQILDEDEIIHC